MHRRIYARIKIHACINSRTHLPVVVHTHAHVCMYIHGRARKFARKYIPTAKHIYTYTYIWSHPFAAKTIPREYMYIDSCAPLFRAAAAIRLGTQAHASPTLAPRGKQRFIFYFGEGRWFFRAVRRFRSRCG